MKHKVCLLSLCLISVLMGTCLSACEGTMTTTTTNEGQSLDDIVNNGDEKACGDWLVGETVDEFGDSTGSTFCYTTCMGTFAIRFFANSRQQQTDGRKKNYAKGSSPYFDNKRLASMTPAF